MNSEQPKNDERQLANERQLSPELLARHAAELVWVQVEPAKIDWFNKIVEAYDNLALVSTVDAAQGLLVCWVTNDMRPLLLKLLSKLPVKTVQAPL